MTGTALDVVTLGETLVAVRAHGHLAHGAPVSASPAGAESNVAIGLARLGHVVRWAGVLGTDPAGDLVVRTLRAEGVDVATVRRESRASTAVMLVDLPAGLPATVTYHRAGSAGSGLAEHDVERALAPAPRLLHVTGITPALSPSAHAAVVAALEAARAAGVVVSFDVNFRGRLWSRAEATRVLTPLATQVDLVIASEDELDLVADGAHEAARVAALLAHGVREVVVKRGSDGATHHDATGSTSCPAHPVTVVTTIGAGDAFTAGYLSGLLDGDTPAERLQRGAWCGALAVAGAGDWEQAPTRAELDALRSASDVVR